MKFVSYFLESYCIFYAFLKFIRISRNVKEKRKTENRCTIAGWLRPKVLQTWPGPAGEVANGPQADGTARGGHGVVTALGTGIVVRSELASPLLRGGVAIRVRTSGTWPTHWARSSTVGLNVWSCRRWGNRTWRPSGVVNGGQWLTVSRGGPTVRVGGAGGEVHKKNGGRRLGCGAHRRAEVAAAFGFKTGEVGFSGKARWSMGFI
jgi:hypothetical protein